MIDDAPHPALVLDMEQARRRRDRRDEGPMPPDDDAPHPGESTKAPAREPRIPPRLSQLCASQPGKYRRIPTYCAPLDRLTGGGLQTRRLVVIAGAPGVTKTGWALQMALEMASRGVQRKDGHRRVVVTFAACDEPRDGLLSRLGQMHGVERAALEDEDLEQAAGAWARVAELLDRIPTLMLFDPRAEGEADTVEEMLEAGAKVAAALDAHYVVVVDSLQTAPFESDALHEEDRTRIEARVRYLQKFAIQRGACVIAISEFSRAGYAQGAIADLASFKGAGGIEYGLDLGLALARVKDGADERGFLIEVTPLKNRLGGDHDPFRLLRTPRCTFEAVDPTGDGEETERLDVDPEEVERVAHEIERALVSARGSVTTRKDLERIVPRAQRVTSRAVSMLLREGRIGGGRGRPFHVVTKAEPEAAQ